jgi:hypothetical protein
MHLKVNSCFPLLVRKYMVDTEVILLWKSMVALKINCCYSMSQVDLLVVMKSQ